MNGGCIRGSLAGFRGKRCKDVTVVYWKGDKRVLKGRSHTAGKIMNDNPDSMVCNADSFFIGKHVAALSINDRLFPGTTYLVLPLDRFSGAVLTIPLLVALCSSRNLNESPFECVKDDDGRVLLKVSPQFIIKMAAAGEDDHIEKQMAQTEEYGSSDICSTPELQRHFVQLVKSKEGCWSPDLETITEYKIRHSPCRFMGLQWKEKEGS